MRCFTALSMTSPRVISSPICSVRYIIPSIRRASTLIVTMKGKKMVHYMHIIPNSIPTFMHLCDKSWGTLHAAYPAAGRTTNPTVCFILTWVRYKLNQNAELSSRQSEATRDLKISRNKRSLTLTLAPSGVDRWFARDDKYAKLQY